MKLLKKLTTYYKENPAPVLPAKLEDEYRIAA